MRIIAGEFRGRRIASPEGRDTRPMLDRVREALFSTLGAAVPEARVLDLFAGTGSLGLEALSRGAEHVRFVESDRRPLRVLKQNVELLDVEDRADCIGGDALEPANWSPEGLPEPCFELAFLDPPYPMWKQRKGRDGILAAVEKLITTGLVPGGTLVLHTHPRELSPRDLPIPTEPRVYGNTALWYLTTPFPESPSSDPPPVDSGE